MHHSQEDGRQGGPDSLASSHGAPRAREVGAPRPLSAALANPIGPQRPSPGSFHPPREMARRGYKEGPPSQGNPHLHKATRGEILSTIPPRRSATPASRSLAGSLRGKQDKVGRRSARLSSRRVRTCARSRLPGGRAGAGPGRGTAPGIARRGRGAPRTHLTWAAPRPPTLQDR